MERDPDKLVIKIGGEGVTPSNVETRATIAFLDAYLALLEAVAAEVNVTSSMRGMEIEPGSLKVVAHPMDARGMKLVAERAASAMRTGFGSERVRRRAGAVRERCRKLPSHYRPEASIGGVTETLPLNLVPPPPSPWEETTIRARLIRIGSLTPQEDTQWAIFEAGSEGGIFSASMDMEKADQIAPYFRKEVDVDVRLRRDAEEVIQDCRLIDFHPLSDMEPREALSRWFAPQATSWNKVEDLDSELRSMRDD